MSLKIGCESNSNQILPTSQRSNPRSTGRAMLGLFPNMRPSSLTPTKCVRPPPSCHWTGTLWGPYRKTAR